MVIFREDKATGISCGINDYGELFCGGNMSGYNLPDTPENRDQIIADFEYWVRDTEYWDV